MKNVDVFISAKSSDFKQAQIVYNFLTSNGLNVFFSKESLPKIGNTDYRKQIDEALDSTKHMVVVTSSRESVSSEWVEAEWGLFINEKRSGIKQGNIITVITGRMDIKDLPASLRYYQVEKLSDEGLNKVLSFLGVLNPRVVARSSKKNIYAIMVTAFIVITSILVYNYNALEAVVDREDPILHPLNNSTNTIQSPENSASYTDKNDVLSVNNFASADNSTRDRVDDSNKQIDYEKSMLKPSYNGNGNTYTDRSDDVKGINQTSVNIKNSQSSNTSQSEVPTQGIGEERSSKKILIDSPATLTPLQDPSRPAESAASTSNLSSRTLDSQNISINNSTLSSRPLPSQAGTNEHTIPINNLFRLPNQ